MSNEELDKAIERCEKECKKIANNRNRSTKNFRKLFDHEVVLHMLKSLRDNNYEKNNL